jgi:hypothetical protein
MPRSVLEGEWREGEVEKDGEGKRGRGDTEDLMRAFGLVGIGTYHRCRHEVCLGLIFPFGFMLMAVFR